MRPIGSGFAPSSAPRSKPNSRSGASCWSIRATALSPTRSSANGTTSCAHWPTAQEEQRAGAAGRPHCVLDDAIRDRLVAMTTDFKTLWRDPSLPNRERKRLLAYIIEDVTLVKLPAEGTTRIHVRFKGGRTETLTTQNPKSSAQQVKTQPKVVELVDMLLDDHIYSEIADILNDRGIRPGGSARRGQAGRAVHRLAGRLSRPSVRAPLPLRPAPGSRDADESRRQLRVSEFVKAR